MRGEVQCGDEGEERDDERTNVVQLRAFAVRNAGEHQRAHQRR